jgi:hypothetical protein
MMFTLFIALILHLQDAIPCDDDSEAKIEPSPDE